MSKKKKYYVVWQGANPGIYESWADCKLQIQGYPGAKYKSYKTESEAREAFSAGAAQEIKRIPKKAAKLDFRSKKIVLPSISVDAASSGNPGIVEYQGVDTETKMQIFHKGPFNKGTNNLGEFLALVHGLAYLQKKGDTVTPVYSDSRTAMSWYRNKKVKTTFFDKYKNQTLKKLVERALFWIKNNEPPNPVLKWDTKNWGEIPADFGRK